MSCKEKAKRAEHARQQRAIPAVNAGINRRRKAQYAESPTKHRDRAQRKRHTVTWQYRQVQGSARARHHEFTLSFEDFCRLRVGARCYWCGTTEMPTCSGGLDRLDNARGYDLANVVPCCTDCNVERGTLSAAEYAAVWALRLGGEEFLMQVVAIWLQRPDRFEGPRRRARIRQPA